MPTHKRRPNPDRIAHPNAHRTPGHIPTGWRYRTQTEALRETLNGKPGRKTGHYLQPAPWGLETLGYQISRHYSNGTTAECWQPAETDAQHPYLAILWFTEDDHIYLDTTSVVNTSASEPSTLVEDEKPNAPLARLTVVVPPQALGAPLRPDRHSGDPYAPYRNPLIQTPPWGRYPSSSRYPHWVNLRTGESTYLGGGLDAVPGAVTYTRIVYNTEELHQVIGELDVTLRVDPEQHVVQAAMIHGLSFSAL